MPMRDVTKYMEKLCSDKPKFFSEIITFIKILVIAPATDTISKMPASCLRRLKNWLRPSKSPERFNFEKHLRRLLLYSQIIKLKRKSWIQLR